MKLDKLLIFIAVIALFSPSHAANDPIEGPVKVSKVTFDNGLAVTNDDNSDMPTPHWVDEVNNADPTTNAFPDGSPDEDKPKTKPDNIKSYAYSYHAEQTPKLEAIFKWKNGAPPEGHPYSAKGLVIDTDNSSFELPKQVLEGDTHYKLASATKKVVDAKKIQAYLTANRKVERIDKAGTDMAKNLKPLKIRWTVYDKDNKVVGESDSTHTIYVTLAAPTTTLRQETLFNVSCVMLDGQNADLSSNEAHEKVFSEFEDRQVKRMSNDLLSYYKAYDTTNTQTTDLLLDADGQCGSWVKFFLDCVKVQGYQLHNSYRTISPINLSEKMMIAKWSFWGAGSSSDPTYPYLNIQAIPFTVGNKYNFPFSEVKDLKGIGGQNNDNPASLFDNHQAAIDGVYYDPSYGTKQTGLQNVDANVHGYYRVSLESFNEVNFDLDVNGDGDKLDLSIFRLTMFIRKNSPDVLDLKEIPSTY